MRYAVLADIHANMAALEAVLRVLEGASVDAYLVAGDVVGYGPHPNECVEAVATLGAICVAGNHDLMALGRLSDERCIPLARASIRWTRTVLGRDARTYLDALPLQAEAPGGVLLAHGSLDDPEEYTANAEQALAQLARLRHRNPSSRVLVLGHTHRPLLVGSKAGRLQPRGTGVVRLREDERYVLNAGGVGQARELRARARCAVLDPASDVIEFHAVRYEMAACRRALRAAGLSPRSLHLRPSPAGAARRVIRRVGGTASILRCEGHV